MAAVPLLLWFPCTWTRRKQGTGMSSLNTAATIQTSCVGSFQIIASFFGQAFKNKPWMKIEDAPTNIKAAQAAAQRSDQESG
jgi:hypothetical protein